MRWLIKILSIVFLAILFLAASLFIGANDQPHQLAFLDWQFATVAVGAWVVAAFTLGLVLGIVVGIPLILGLRRQNKQMQKKLSASRAVTETAS